MQEVSVSLGQRMNKDMIPEDSLEFSQNVHGSHTNEETCDSCTETMAVDQHTHS